MDIFQNISIGIVTAFSLHNLLYCVAGVTIGTAVGVLPGIGPFAAVAMLMPITFHLSPDSALIMLAGIYYGAQYGGSTAAILLNLPGTVSSAVTCLDGYPMASTGRAGPALCITTLASFMGSFIGVLVLAGFAPLLAKLAIQFSAPEYFALMLLGLLAAAFITQGSPLRAVIMVALGLLLGIVGTDINTGVQRFVFGETHIADGLNIVAVAMGLFGVSEVIANAAGHRQQTLRASDITWRTLIPTKDDLKASFMPALRGTGVGAWFGVLPGTGTTIAPFIAYVLEKRISRHPEKFGTGIVEGIAAPEAANNAAAQTSFVPTLTLGIPGDVIMALMLGTMIVHGVFPGPFLIQNNPEIFWGLIFSFLIGNAVLVVLNLPLVGIWVRFLTIPYWILYPWILAFICIGVYSVNNSVFDIFLVVLFGFLGYGMMLLRFEPAPLIMGFVLGPMMEENLRRALTFSRGSFWIFVERPFSAAFLALTAAIVAMGIYRRIRTRGGRRAQAVS